MVNRAAQMRKKACPTHDKPDNGDVSYTDRLFVICSYVYCVVLCFSLMFSPLSLIVVPYTFSVDLLDMS